MSATVGPPRRPAIAGSAADLTEVNLGTGKVKWSVRVISFGDSWRKPGGGRLLMRRASAHLPRLMPMNALVQTPDRHEQTSKKASVARAGQALLGFRPAFIFAAVFFVAVFLATGFWAGVFFAAAFLRGIISWTVA